MWKGYLILILPMQFFVFLLIVGIVDMRFMRAFSLYYSEEWNIVMLHGVYLPDP